MPKSFHSCLVAMILLLVSAGLYSPGLAGPMLFDDQVALTDNELIRIDGAEFDDWRSAAFSSRSGLFQRPVSMLTFTANYVASGGFETLSLKSVNLAIHLAIGVLLYFLFVCILRALGRGGAESSTRLIALTGAAIWLLHPLHVSTVLYIVQRMAQLSALFVVAGLLVFMRYRLRWAEAGATAGDLMAAALWLFLFMVLAVLSKENGALLPWLVVVLEVTLFRGRWAGVEQVRLRRLGYLALLLPFLIVWLVLATNPDVLIGAYVRREFTLEERILTQARLLWHYLGWIVFPNIHAMGFQHDDIPLSVGLFEPITTIIAVLAWPVALLVALRFHQRWPLLLAALLFFLVGHSMESSIIPLEMAYEHRNYLPAMLVCLLVANTLIVPLLRIQKVSIAYPVLGVLAVLSALLFVRANTWSDELTLSRVNVNNHPQSSRSNYFYANAQLNRYRNRVELQLGEQELNESLLLSRHYFERMYQTNERDVAALVMLFYLDGRFFPELRARVDWLQVLEELIETRRLHPSDWNALDTLVACLAGESCSADEERVLALLDTLGDRYPASWKVARYRYVYLSSRDSDAPELVPLLLQAQQRNPGSPWVYYPLLSEQARLGDVGAMYESARLWLKYDRQRHSLRLLKRLFVSEAGPADD